MRGIDLHSHLAPFRSLAESQGRQGNVASSRLAPEAYPRTLEGARRPPPPLTGLSATSPRVGVPHIPDSLAMAPTIKSMFWSP